MLGAGIVVGEGTVIRDSIIMRDTQIGRNCHIYKSIIAEDCSVGDNVDIGIGDEIKSKLNDKIYAFGLATIGENSCIPSNVKIGKNTAISGVTDKADYPDGVLAGGEYIIKAGDSK